MEMLANPIVGQTMAAGGDGPPVVMFPLLVLALIAGVAVILLPIWLGIRHDRQKRELEHIERMRAIEAGRLMPGERPKGGPERVAMAIAVKVPLGVFGMAWLATITTNTRAEALWPSAGAVGLAAVICGSILAARLPSAAPEASRGRSGKPHVDPDAYEMVEHHHP